MYFLSFDNKNSAFDFPPETSDHSVDEYNELIISLYVAQYTIRNVSNCLGKYISTLYECV